MYFYFGHLDIMNIAWTNGGLLDSAIEKKLTCLYIRGALNFLAQHKSPRLVNDRLLFLFRRDDLAQACVQTLAGFSISL